MRLTVLGSGTALSNGNRARAGYLIEGSKNSIVLDLGYGAFMNLERAIDTSKINCLLFTHIKHPDHCADLIAFIEDRYGFNKFNPGKEKQLNIFGPKGFKEFFKKVQGLFPNFSQLQFPVKVKEIEYGKEKIFEFKISSKPVKHVKNSIGYRIESNGKAIAYSGDTGYCQEIIDLGKDADLLVLECSLARTKSEGHLNATQCGEIAAKANAKALLLSHFYPESEKSDVNAMAKKKFSGRIYVAKDLMQVKI